ncbi:MAG TPA: TIGR03118 family protein [Rhizomicrobium sp.]|nr:TIGR03118 family protein [Rhizomicrobium sp.]
MRSAIRSFRNWVLASCAAAPLFSIAPALAAGVEQTNLVSDMPGLALVTDPSLVNPWGMATSGTSPWWISDNGTGLSTLYNGTTGVKSATVVTILPEAGGVPPSAPTGQVFNNTSGFVLSNGTKASFIFSTENGTIAGWNGAAGSTAITMADLSSQGSVFKGLAIGSVGSANYLYATDFAHGSVQVFNTGFTPTTLGGGFTDPNLPSGYAPFGIQNLGGKIYVTYAEQGDNGDEIDALGLGLVDVFDTGGNLISRVATGGTLDAPWGLAIAPSGFGAFSNDLLVGNFGDGTINAYDPDTFGYLGQLLDRDGNVISIDGLWALGTGNGGNSGNPNGLYFTAGPNDESNGLFGVLSVPEPATWTLLLIGFGAAGFGLRRRRVCIA